MFTFYLNICINQCVTKFPLSQQSIYCILKYIVAHPLRNLFLIPSFFPLYLLVLPLIVLFPSYPRYLLLPSLSLTSFKSSLSHFSFNSRFSPLFLYTCLSLSFISSFFSFPPLLFLSLPIIFSILRPLLSIYTLLYLSYFSNFLYLSSQSVSSSTSNP